MIQFLLDGEKSVIDFLFERRKFLARTVHRLKASRSRSRSLIGLRNRNGDPWNGVECVIRNHYGFRQMNLDRGRSRIKKVRGIMRSILRILRHSRKEEANKSSGRLAMKA